MGEICSRNRRARKIHTIHWHKIQFRGIVIDQAGMLTGHNTLRRHLHIMGLCNDPICKKCGTEEETSVHILCEREALASLRHAYLGSIFFGPGGYKGARHGGHLELC